MFSKIFICVCIFYSFVSANIGRSCIQTEGDLCLNGDGVCTLVDNCPPALEAVIENHRHGFDRCGFKGRNEIVCCPLSELTTGTFKETKPDPTTKPNTSTKPTIGDRSPTVRKSKQACDKYANEIPPKLDYQIIGGEDAQLGEFPHMAAIGFEVDGSNELDYNCGGSLISSNYILTAAHCLVKQGLQAVQVRLGKIDIKNNTDNVTAQDFAIENITVHPNYSNLRKVNDIALIRFRGKVTTNENVYPACLYHQSDDPIGLVTTGWGVTLPEGETSNILQKATLRAVPVPECNRTLLTSAAAKPILFTHICATSDDNTPKDACRGDSGGPLQALVHKGSGVYSIVGITSYGRACGGSYPGIYTRVHSFTDWIEGIVWPS